VRRVCLFLALSAHAIAADQAGKSEFVLRGQRQNVYVYRVPAGTPRARILFLPGDGGWRGFAIAIARQLPEWGYEVWGFDTRRYLESFTGAGTLTEGQVAEDLRAAAGWAKDRSSTPVILVGWSEGAGLGVLGAAPEGNRSALAGLVAIGLPDCAVLGWRLADTITWITKRMPNEPRFLTGPHLARVAPLPFAMIHSTGDEYTPPPAARKLFERAGEPKRLFLVQARNHRFEGNQDEFFRSLRESLEWILRKPA